MIEWRAEGILLAARAHGETSAILDVLTRERGRHAGVVRGGQSRKMAPILQPGAQLDLTWRARIEDHIGAFTFEPVRSRSAQIMADRAALACLTGMANLLQAALPERQSSPVVYDATYDVMNSLGVTDDWAYRYAHWELTLLADLGFGLDLTECAVTGVTQNLIYVSPKSGRAVSAQGAGEWADRLLPLPELLRMEGAGGNLADAFRLTGHFLTNWLEPTLTRPRALDARHAAIEVILRR